MFARFADFDHFDRTFSVVDELKRRMDRVWEDYEPASAGQSSDAGIYASSSWPKVNVYDTGEALVLRADVPGLGEKDFQITWTPDGLTLAGERKATALEGYANPRQERPTARFSRSWTLPHKIDGERTTASLKDGVLTITLAKAAEAQPRQIAVRAQS